MRIATYFKRYYRMHTEETAVRCKYKSVNISEKPFEYTIVALLS